MEKNRLEAFSDGVFAVAITLLAFDLTVPDVRGRRLAGALGAEWPHYAAYVVSFAVIGIIWINHHSVLALVAKVDRRVLSINLAMLLPVVTIPFATQLFATYVRKGGIGGEVAAAVYSGVMLLLAVTMSALHRAVVREESLLHESVDVAAARSTTRRFGIGQVLYVGTVGLSFLSPIATLIAHAVLAVYYFFDQLRPRTDVAAPRS